MRDKPQTGALSGPSWVGIPPLTGAVITLPPLGARSGLETGKDRDCDHDHEDGPLVSAFPGDAINEAGFGEEAAEVCSTWGLAVPGDAIKSFAGAGAGAGARAKTGTSTGIAAAAVKAAAQNARMGPGDRYLTAAQAVGLLCGRGGGGTIPHVTSPLISAVQDLERLWDAAWTAGSRVRPDAQVSATWLSRAATEAAVAALGAIVPESGAGTGAGVGAGAGAGAGARAMLPPLPKVGPRVATMVLSMGSVVGTWPGFSVAVAKMLGLAGVPKDPVLEPLPGPVAAYAEAVVAMVHAVLREDWTAVCAGLPEDLLLTGVTRPALAKALAAQSAAFARQRVGRVTGPGVRLGAGVEGSDLGPIPGVPMGLDATSLVQLQMNIVKAGAAT